MAKPTTFAAMGMLLLISACGHAAGQNLALWASSGEEEIALDPTGRQTLIDSSAEAAVSEIYFHVYQPDLSPAGRHMFDDAVVADIVAGGLDAGIDVWAAYGSPEWADPEEAEWPTEECNPEARSMALLGEVIAYNADNPDTPLAGIMLDVEPASGRDETAPGDRWLEGLMVLYRCALDLYGDQVQVGAAIRHYWDSEPRAAVIVNGIAKPAARHAIDMDFDRIVVLGYRDDAAAMADLVADEVAYAETTGAAGLIGIGVETANCAPPTGNGKCAADSVTFYEEGRTAMEAALAEAQRILDSPAVWGGAIHQYRRSFLGPGW